jgi:hypothetical protein
MKKFITSLLITSSALSFSAEVDQFTRRNEFLEDSADIINQKANDQLQMAIQNLNLKSNCNEAELYKELRKYFANHSKGELTKFILHSKEVKLRTMKIQDSIFKNWKITDGYLLGKPSANNSALALSPLVRVGDIVIGVDKFEHMFGRGFSYFKQHYLEAKTVEKAIKSGVFGEKTIYGGNKIATGVFSYADLSANFNGMRFWNHILQKSDDVIGDNHGPFIKCINQKWEQTKEIDFTHYIDSSMDEAINCSKFPTKKTAQKYRDEVSKTIQREGLSNSTNGCPLINIQNEGITNKYKNISKWIINQEVDRTINYLNEM